MTKLAWIGWLALAACGGNRADQCAKWKTQFNQATAAVTDGAVNTADDAKRAVAEMEQAQRAFAAIQIDDETLRGFRAEYAALAVKKAATMRDAQAAAEKSDQAAWAAVGREAEANDSAEDALTARVADYCK